MPAPFGLLIVFRVDSLCFVFRNVYYYFVLLLFLLFSVVCAGRFDRLGPGGGSV